MNQKNTHLNQDQPTPETLDAPKKTKGTQPGRSRLFFRKVLLWLVVVAIAFLAGIVADHYLRYKPLQEELKTTTAHLVLYQVLDDVSNARLALSTDDVAGAKAALLNTQQRLDDLLPHIAVFDASLAESMPQRLSLIISGLDRDPETAKYDLELFSRDLIEVDAALFND